MAYELVAEVLDHAPSDLTPAERLVMVVIAEYVHTEDYKRGIRSTSRPAADIGRRAGLRKEGLKEALQRLARRKLDVRTPLAIGRDGRPVYALPGKSGTYEIPELPAPADCFCDACKKAIPMLGLIHKGGPQPPLANHKGGPQPRLGGATAPPGGATAPPNQSRVPGKSSPRASVTKSGPTDEDLDTIIEEIKDHAGVTATADHARCVYRDVLGRAGTTTLRHPLSYVLKAIREEPHRYRPTPTPAPARQQPLLSLVEPVPPGKPVSDEKRAHLRTGWKQLGRASPAEADGA
jgi:hypothetical protein